MGNLFDGYKKTLTQIVQKTMGDTAVWNPSNGSAQQTALVLFNNPTRDQKLNDVEYNPYDWQMEFHHDQFTGLKALVDSGATEVITIDADEYYVKDVITKWDGDLSLAKLQMKD